MREVKATDGSKTVSYRYDAAGNRIEKRISSLSSPVPPTAGGEGRASQANGMGEVTRYLRDASGNVMAIYQNDKMIEQPLYGSSRLGMYKGGRKEGQRLLGKKNYELTNHLGNVLTVITDNAGMKPDSTWATVITASDYYPFGLPMKDRTFSNDTYRYGFNGKEKDNSISSTADYDYGARFYNPVTARWFVVDPFGSKYPSISPYVFVANSPLIAIDPDGKDIIIVGSPTYVANTKKALIELANSSEEGARLVNEMLSSINKVVFVKHEKNRGLAAAVDQDGIKTYVIGFNPELRGTIDNVPRIPSVSADHELKHAEKFFNNDVSEEEVADIDQPLKNEQVDYGSSYMLNAVLLDEFDAMDSENLVRAAFGGESRKAYDGVSLGTGTPSRIRKSFPYKYLGKTEFTSPHLVTQKGTYKKYAAVKADPIKAKKVTDALNNERDGKPFKVNGTQYGGGKAIVRKFTYRK